MVVRATTDVVVTAEPDRHTGAVTSSEPDPPAAGDPSGDHAGQPSRDPQRVRLWGWVAFAAAVVIVVVGLFVGRPWRSCHCPLPRHSHSMQPVVVQPVRLTTTSVSVSSAPRAGTSGSSTSCSRALSA